MIQDSSEMQKKVGQFDGGRVPVPAQRHFAELSPKLAEPRTTAACAQALKDCPHG